MLHYVWLPVHQLAMVSKSLVIDIMADLGYCFYSALVQPPWSLLIPIRSIMNYKSAIALATFLVHLNVVIFSLPFPTLPKTWKF